MIFTIQSKAKAGNVNIFAPRRVSVLPLAAPVSHVWRIQSVTSFVPIQTSPIIMTSEYKLDSEYQCFYWLYYLCKYNTNIILLLRAAGWDLCVCIATKSHQGLLFDHQGFPLVPKVFPLVTKVFFYYFNLLRFF